MKAYGVNELRRMFLDFFESKGHLKMKSFSLVPHNDNSLLIINLFYVTGESAQKALQDLPKVHSYRGSGERGKDCKTRHFF